MEECCEKKADLLRVRQLLETLPAREQILLLRYGLAGQPPDPAGNSTAAGISRGYVSVWKRCASCASVGQKTGAGVKHFSVPVSESLFGQRALDLVQLLKVYSRFRASTSSFLEGAAGPVRSTALPYALRCPACRSPHSATGPCR